VKGEEQHVGARVEDRLGAVAVVVVDIEERDPGWAAIAALLRKQYPP
jgi:hypothetical protein